MTRREEVVDVAERLLEAEGPEALTMRRLGGELGMRAPSLYKHVTGKDDIVCALQARALDQIARVLAPTAGDVAALTHAYRTWARAHPRLYELTTRQPLQRDRLPPGVETAAAAPLLAATAGDVDRARALWAVAHGLIDLELAGRFPPDADLDAAWDAAINAFTETSGRAMGRRPPD